MTSSCRWRRPTRCAPTASPYGGHGQAYDDPAGLLRGATGRTVDVALDLEFATAGTPYQYRITPRYEIPCTVTGTTTVAGTTYALAAVPRPA